MAFVCAPVARKSDTQDLCINWVQTPARTGHVQRRDDYGDKHWYASECVRARVTCLKRIPNSVTISGIEVPVQMRVTGGRYSIGCSGTFTSNAESISNGQTVCPSSSLGSLQLGYYGHCDCGRRIRRFLGSY